MEQHGKSVGENKGGCGDQMMLLISIALLLCNLVCGYKNSFVARSVGSNMVLQRNVPNNIGGFSTSPSTQVSVFFNHATFQAISESVAAKDGGYYWQVILPPMEGGFSKYSINITSTIGETKSLENIVFGDVFLCSGQSNMQWQMYLIFNSTEEIATANDYPDIRIFSVGQDFTLTQDSGPLDDLNQVAIPWTQSSSTSVNDFSSVCWLHGRALFNTVLDKAIPIGLVSSNWGGTPIEAWCPSSVVEACVSAQSDALFKDIDSYPLASSIASTVDFDPNKRSALFDAMIYPFRNMAFNGILWYQGESNVNNPVGYSCMQKGMVTIWRNLFQRDVPFIYTQLSTWNAGGTDVLPDFREMQHSFLSVMDKVTMITAADIGDPYSVPYTEIHPRNKTEVGRRMALASSSLIYAAPVPHLGPTVTGIFSDYSDKWGGWSVEMTFDQWSCGEGVYWQAPQECPPWSVEVGGCGPTLLSFNFAGAESVEVVEADVVITGAASVRLVPHGPVRGPRGPAGIADTPSKVLVSYGWGDYPLMTIYNSIGAPLLPFKTEASMKMGKV